jgi:tRNA-specific 2-thiouridylase
MSRKIRTVVIAMSGGVDSSAAAALLVDQGYDVIGVTMKLWDYEEVGGNVNHESGCCSISNINDARIVCNMLGIPHYVVNFSATFSESVVKNFVGEYMQGRTPNPCVLCNTRIKWDYLVDKLDEYGADALATGHYARVDYDEKRQRFRLFKGRDTQKDQSYALWGVKQKALAHTLFPLSDMLKDESRKVAERFGLRIAKKSESQEICFVPDDDYRSFLKRNAKDPVKTIQTGPLVNRAGEVLGEHYGYPFYTIGQRRGLGKGLQSGFGDKLYVIDIIPAENKVVLGSEEDLYQQGLEASALNLIGRESIVGELAVSAKIRYNDLGAPAYVSQLDEQRIRVKFPQARKAIAPGQSIVFYDGDEVLGGAIIDKAI